jgi:hypothetical protein
MESDYFSREHRCIPKMDADGAVDLRQRNRAIAGRTNKVPFSHAAGLTQRPLAGVCDVGKSDHRSRERKLGYGGR